MQRGGRDVKVVEIEVVMVDKAVPTVLVDARSGPKILPKQTMKKLGFSLTSPSFHHQYGQPKSNNVFMND